jgi:hypothetical protein
MIKTSDEIREILIDAYPKLNHKRIWLTDTKFLLPTMDELVEAVAANSVKGLSFKPVTQECEEFALYLAAGVRRWHAAMEPEANWAFGEAAGHLYGLLGKTNHNTNICITTDDVVWIEPQSDLVHKVNLDKYSVYMVKI